MKNKNLIITILLVVIVWAGAFYGGMKYQQRKRPSFNRQFGQSIGQGQRNGQNFRPVNGEIISADDKSITVKMQDGSSKIVLLNDKTEINKASEATKEDLKTGEKVMAMGQENSDGSITAQSIQLNLIFRGNPTGIP
jgi:flagellar basal body-associated protein FliL